jgi:flagellin
MALGVLNNISAIYAQNNLSNTQASLSKTLQQLSSGSRINSGADDAAGLSLANGLQASATALSQSAKNAAEGVDFLQVADGALAQVTSLLNRAVTLATEAGNGTLNSSQTSAANSEYQKILGEVDTINSNTEYNGIQTFAQNAAYTVGNANDTIKIGTGAVGDYMQVDYADGTSLKIGNSNGTTVGATLLSATPKLSDLAKAINAGSGSTVASVVNNQLVLTGGASIDAAGTPALTSTNTIAAGSTAVQVGSASNTLGAVSGLSVSYGGASTSLLVADTTLQAVMNDINTHVHAGLATISGNNLVLASGASISGTFTETQAAAGTGTNQSVAIFTSDGTLNKSYNNASTDVIKADSGALNLAGTTLDAAHAQAALSAINAAITSVAASRGTIGANINTLTAVENVMTTQSTNTLAAQNDVTATDYGQATSDMSKFQILSQTGIAALAQANQSQQLITKLLQ